MTALISELGNISYILEIMITILVGLYTYFAFLVMRQTKMLNGGFRTDSAKLLSHLAGAHFLATIALLIFSLFSILI